MIVFGARSTSTYNICRLLHRNEPLYVRMDYPMRWNLAGRFNAIGVDHLNDRLHWALHPAGW
jgi:hypothetical protein